MVAAGADPGDGLGITVEGRVVLDRDGRPLCAVDDPHVLTSWGRAYGFLRRACPDGIYHHGKALARIEQVPGQVIAHFEDGSRETGSILVAADGAQSTARRLLFPEAGLAYAGYCAWRGMVDEGC